MNKLPKLQEIYDGDIELKGEQNALNILLNQPPKPEWIKNHPFAKGVKYIPIERIEYLLTRIFIKWRVEVKQIQTIANSCVVTVRLHYQNVEDMEWSWQDGIGAAPIQTKKDTGAMDWNEVLTDAVMKSAPAAESYAIKDAAEKIGKIFGKDMNRKDEIIYDSLPDINKPSPLPDEEVPGPAQRGFAEQLCRTSDYDHDTQALLEKKIWSGYTSKEEIGNIIEDLKNNQPKKH